MADESQLGEPLDSSAGELAPSEPSESEIDAMISDGDNLEVTPGETSESEIEAFMAETERRFEEAQQEIDQQFKEAESKTPDEMLNEVDKELGQP